MRARINNLINLINKESGLDIFRNTRKRDYVEARALLTFLLRNYFKLRLSEIQRIFAKNGYPIHHATLLHAIRNFEDTYLAYSPTLKVIYDAALTNLNNKIEFKIKYIQSRIEELPLEKLDKINQAIDELV